MNDIILKHLKACLEDNLAMAKELPESAFKKKLPVRSNTIGGQFFCVAGTREWYNGMLPNGRWMEWGTTFNDDDFQDKDHVIKALKKTSRDLLKTVKLIKKGDGAFDMILHLIKHETLHTGQLVRYFYGLGYKFPKGVAKKWALKE